MAGHCLDLGHGDFVLLILLQLTALASGSCSLCLIFIGNLSVFLILEHIVVGVGSPETLNELMLVEMALTLWIDAVDESLKLFIGQAQVKSDDGLLQLAS